MSTLSQSNSTATKIEIKWPEPPECFERFNEEENRRAFQRWYYDMRNAMNQQLENLAKVIDKKADKTI